MSINPHVNNVLTAAPHFKGFVRRLRSRLASPEEEATIRVLRSDEGRKRNADIERLTNPKAMIDYHVHTSLCNHATGTMEQYVRAAVDKGLATICFLDHLTFQEGGRANAMVPREVPMYIYEARRLAREYHDRIIVRVGLEVDFSPRHVEQCRGIVDTFDLDVVGSSVHFSMVKMWSAVVRPWASGEMAADAVYLKYLAVLESMLDYDYFDVVCHLDLPKKFNQRPSPSVLHGFGTYWKKSGKTTWLLS
jgi:HisJ family histidinol phosphate phosphatase